MNQFKFQSIQIWISKHWPSPFDSPSRPKTVLHRKQSSLGNHTFLRDVIGPKKFASRFNCASRRKPRNYTVRVGIIFMLMKRNSCGKAIFLLEKITKTVLLAYRESLTFSNQLLIASHAFCKWASAIAGSRCDVITVQFIGTCRPP